MTEPEPDEQSQASRGVSPAIAVILMATVAIILAAVIGAFVLGIGGQTEETAPVVSAEIERTADTSVTFESGNEQIRLSHKRGDNVPVSELNIITEVQCFDSALLVDNGRKRGKLVNLPVDGTGGVQSNNVRGEDIFQTGGPATEAPLSGNDETWTAGEQLTFEVDVSKCDVPSNSRVDVQIAHKPSNSIIVDKTSGTAFFSAALQNDAEPATAGATSTHSLALDVQAGDYGTAGNSGDEVDSIEIDYDPNGDGNASNALNGLDQDNVTVTMTRTLSGGLDRSDITVNSGSYSGESATFNLNGLYTTDVAGPIEIEISGIENPSSAGTYPVEITLDGEAGQKTFTTTLEIGT